MAKEMINKNYISKWVIKILKILFLRKKYIYKNIYIF